MIVVPKKKKREYEFDDFVFFESSTWVTLSRKYIVLKEEFDERIEYSLWECCSYWTHAEVAYGKWGTIGKVLSRKNIENIELLQEFEKSSVRRAFPADFTA